LAQLGEPKAAAKAFADARDNIATITELHGRANAGQDAADRISIEWQQVQVHEWCIKEKAKPVGKEGADSRRAVDCLDAHFAEKEIENTVVGRNLNARAGTAKRSLENLSIGIANDFPSTSLNH
jgi:hypothetical protein